MAGNQTKLLIMITLMASLCLPHPALAQDANYFRKTYTIDDGLPNDHVRWITQDSSGFLWICTWDGLARFDGSEFKTYRHNPKDTSSVAFFEIIKALVDSENRLWVFAGGRLCRYNPLQDNFIRYDILEFLPRPDSGVTRHLNTMEIDPFGRLLCCCTDGLFSYNATADRFEKARFDGWPRSALPGYITFDDTGNLWLFCDRPGRRSGDLLKCSYSEGGIISILDKLAYYQPLSTQFYNNETLHITAVSGTNGSVWFYTSKGLLLLNGDTLRSFHGMVPRDDIPAGRSMIWSIPGRGLRIGHPGHDVPDSLFRAGEIQNVIAYFEDNQQNIWFSDISNSSTRSGLSLVYRTGTHFRHYLVDGITPEPDLIFGLATDARGNIWAGGRPNNRLLMIRPDGVAEKIPLPFSPVKYYNMPRNIIPDRKGNLWIAFFQDYLFQLNPETMEFHDYSWIFDKEKVQGTLPLFRIVRPLENGRMFAAGGGRMYVFDPSSGDVITESSPHFWDMYSVHQAADGSLWIGLSGRLLHCNSELQQQEVIEISDQLYNIEDICPGDSSDLWLALLGGGIARYSISSGEVNFFSSFDGLAHNTVYSLLRDDAGNLWASHDLGISMLNIKTGSFVNYDEKDGLMIREFDSEAAFRDTGGDFLFGGVGGIVRFSPGTVNQSRHESPAELLISDFRISGNIVGQALPISGDASITLPKGTDNFQAGFVKPDFRYGDQLRYRFMLAGINEEWNTTDSRHRWVNFTGLKPGKYRFVVQATGLKGGWRHQASLYVTIPPYFYQTIFFKVVLVCIVLAVISLFFLMKLKQIRLNEKKIQEQLKLETLRGQMNPHFIYNSLNSINYFLSLNDPRSANQYMTDFSRLMRAIMTNSSHDFITLDAEIETLRDYLALEHLRFSDKFDWVIEVDDRIDAVNTEVAPSLIQPFVENAVWHGLRGVEGRKGMLSVRISPGENKSLVCVVEDDGVGRMLSMRLKTGDLKKRRSRGMALVRERLALIGSVRKSKYSVTVSDLFPGRSECGTSVRLELPCNLVFKNE